MPSASNAHMLLLTLPPVVARGAPTSMEIMVIKRLRSVNDAVSTV
jgi:hypothetical protein